MVLVVQVAGCGVRNGSIISTKFKSSFISLSFLPHETVNFTFRRGQQGILSALGIQPRELELIMHGVPTIDLDDWQKHTRYKGRYDAQSPGESNFLDL